tara:strand:+ start:798 stop:1781 length:984 start_codon:yes stop_codon:yes gene_type:complete
MIVKNFEQNKIDYKKNNFFLFYGENQGYKDQVIDEKFKKNFLKSTYYYDEGDILNNENNFFNNILSKSFFENEKLIIINRSTDKIIKLISELIEKKIIDLVFVLNANTLEKKSKLRSLFEKNKEVICIAFYEDNNQTLAAIINLFFRERKIPISQQSVNLIVGRCRGDRLNLTNELQKIEGFIGNERKINLQDLLKLTNLAENYNVSELINNCLSKNKKRTAHILNENNYSSEDCILIIRSFLIKSKQLIKLCKEMEKTNNIDNVISSFKPPIFWKDKEIIKQQIRNWSSKDVEELIYKINETEFLIKKYSNNSINILSNFIIEQAA